MTEKKKIFTKSNFKLGLAAVTAAFLLSMAPKTAFAQETKKNKVENFDFAKASEKEQKVYKAMVELFGVKLDKDFAEKMAGKIIVDSRQFKDEVAGNYIQISANIVMKGYEKEMEAAREKVGVKKAVVTRARTEKVSPAAKDVKSAEVKKNNETPAVVATPAADNKKNNEIDEAGVNAAPVPRARAKRDMPADSVAVTVTPHGTEKVATEVNGNEVIKTTVVEKNFDINRLNETERAVYDRILAKIKVSNSLKHRSSALDQATAIAVFSSPADMQDRLLKTYTRGILFRDVDDKSFVAYNTEDGIGRIYAPKEDMKAIEKMVKKAGGLSAFVEAGQKKKVNKTENGNQSSSNTINFERNR